MDASDPSKTIDTPAAMEEDAAHVSGEPASANVGCIGSATDPDPSNDTDTEMKDLSVEARESMDPEVDNDLHDSPSKLSCMVTEGETPRSESSVVALEGNEMVPATINSSPNPIITPASEDTISNSIGSPKILSIDKEITANLSVNDNTEVGDQVIGNTTSTSTEKRTEDTDCENPIEEEAPIESNIDNPIVDGDDMCVQAGEPVIEKLTEDAKEARTEVDEMTTEDLAEVANKLEDDSNTDRSAILCTSNDVNTVSTDQTIESVDNIKESLINTKDSLLKEPVPHISSEDKSEALQVNQNIEQAIVNSEKVEPIDSGLEGLVAENNNEDKSEVQQAKQNIGEAVTSLEKAEPMDVDEIATTNSDLHVSNADKMENPNETENINGQPIDDTIYYNKDCINCLCKREHKQYVRASLAAVNYFNVSKKIHKKQYICLGCYDNMMDVYEEYATLLMAKQPVLLHKFEQDAADIVALDSSDEEDNTNETERKDFSINDLSLIENELKCAIESVMNKVQFERQLSWSKSIMQRKADNLETQFEFLDTEIANLQSQADKMHLALYSSYRVSHKHMPPLDLYQPSGHEQAQFVPPPGEIERPPIQMNEVYYAIKNKAIASWVSVRVVEIMENTAVGGNTMTSYKVKYLNTPYQMLKTVPAKHMAYFHPPSVRLNIGTRVIAYFDSSTLVRGREKCMVQSAFYPGIIAEPLKQTNRFRYLIFYDDGYTKYVDHKDVRLVCQASDKVWEDVHPVSRDFIQKYVEKYSVNRPMVQCTRGHSIKTEKNGTWTHARVIDIDCSLVLLQFEGDKNHTEWIYRGSLRLGPVLKETQNALSATTMQQHTRVPRRTEPYIRYTKEMEASTQQVKQQQRAIARKSSSQPPNIPSSTSSSSFQSASNNAAPSGSNAARNTVRHLNNSTIYVDDENRPKGHVVYFRAKRNLPPKIYSAHECAPNCLFKIVHRLDSYSPLSKPLLSGWERLVMRQKIKRSVVYRGPCGKSLRNLAEVHMYLRATNNVLNVENFDFTPDLHCLAEYSIDPTIVKEADISKGQEKMAIPLVNYYDNTLPPPCTYAKQRIPTEGVNLNLDPEFLVGCECEDDCSDKSKCSCWKLTIEGAKYSNPNQPIEEIGYQYKRLHEHVPTGIYECNSRCKCKKNCLNRVVQHSLEMKLQVFKTSNRGWGLRCVNDIPKGAFICIYAGHLLTETKANEGGHDAGDEYYADLDYIEVAEQLKEGYESEVEKSDTEEDEDPSVPDPDDDDEFTLKKHYNIHPRSKEQRSTRHNAAQNETDSQERAVINFNPNVDLDETVKENSVRRLFGKEEAPYIMDAKTTGNLGRYFNHSCSPNLFVQNVFVDTHDLRFPWVAFFSANHIRSGTELTWNYNYEVGAVPGKVLYCQCGSTNCRIRLL